MNSPIANRKADIRVESCFVEVGRHRLYTLHLRPAGQARGTLVYLPPWAEELNRCRSLVADAARALAADGWHCILVDPFATGESDGETEDADWGTWVEDTLLLLRDLPTARGETILWGLRTGALLAAEVAAAAPDLVSRLLLWHPVVDGNLFLNQYLRLRLASQVIHTGTKETTDLLRRRLAAGDTLEVAGYPLSGPLASALNRSKLAELAPKLKQPVMWVEVGGEAGAPASVASRKLIDAWPTAIALETVAGQLVWQVHERANAAEMVLATLRLLNTSRI